MSLNDCLIMHLKNHNYNPRDDVLRTYCGKSRYDMYADREEWTDDISIVDCAECIDIKNAMDNK